MISITHIFSALCIHTIDFCRTTSTLRKLAEHRAKLCLLGLQELQKSWDLENWVLDLFFRCLDDSTARNLRIVDGLPSPRAYHTPNPSQSRSTDPGSAGVPIAAPTPQSQTTGATVPVPDVENNLEDSGDIAVHNEWLFNFTDDYADVLGLTTSPPDSINPQNLEWLYRFL